MMRIVQAPLVRVVNIEPEPDALAPVHPRAGHAVDIEAGGHPPAAGNLADLALQARGLAERIQRQSTHANRPGPAAPIFPELAIPTIDATRVNRFRRMGITAFYVGLPALVAAVPLASSGFTIGWLFPGKHGLYHGLLTAGEALSAFGAVSLLASFLLGKVVRHLQAVRTVGDWQRSLQLPAVPRPWHRDQSEGMKNFMMWLSKLDACADYRVARRPAFLGQVRDVLAAIDTDSQLREEVMNIATEASVACGDRTSWGLNQMVMAVQNRAAEQGNFSDRQLLKLGRGMYRLGELQRLVAAQTRNVHGHVDAQVLLRERLDLPVVVTERLYVSGLAADQFNSLGDEVLRNENTPAPAAALESLNRQLDALQKQQPLPDLDSTPHSLAHYLACEYTPWARHVGRSEEGEIAQQNMQQLTGDYLENLGGQPRSIDEGTYLKTCDQLTFLRDHGVAYRHALLAVVGDEVGRQGAARAPSDARQAVTA